MIDKIKNNLFYYYLLIMTFLFVVIPKDFGNLFNIIPLRLVLLSILFIIYLYELFFKKKKMNKCNKIITAFSIGLLIIVIPGFFVATSKIMYLYSLAKVVCFLFLIYVISTYPLKKEQYNCLIKCLIITSLVVSVIGIIQYIAGVNLNANGIYKYAGAKGRTISTFFNPIYFSVFLLFINTLILSYNVIKKNWFYIVIFVINLIALLITFTRTTAILMAINIFIYFLFSIIGIRKDKKGFFKNCLILIVTYLLVIIIPGVKYLYSSTLVNFIPNNFSFEILKFTNKYLFTNIDLELYGYDPELEIEINNKKEEVNNEEENVVDKNDKPQTSDKNDKPQTSDKNNKPQVSDKDNNEQEDSNNKVEKPDNNTEEKPNKNDKVEQEVVVDDASINSRQTFKKIAEQVIEENKLFGVGLGNYEEYVKSDFKKYKVKKFGYPHNSFLHLQAEAGIGAGIIFHILVILFMGYLLIKTITTKSKTYFSLLLIWVNSYILFYYESLIFDTQLLPLLLIMTIAITNRENSNDKKRVLFISSVGGHLTQLLTLKETFKDYDYLLMTDKTDVSTGLANNYNVKYLIYGSRYYLLPYLFIFTYNCLKSLIIFIDFDPDVIVTTGAHTAVPMCYYGFGFGKKVIYIESFAKNSSPTLAGRLVYPIATKFVVQWESMLKFYPKADYWGGIY